ncbi:MAG: cation:proton antiporter [Candidatus Nanohaloarchaea archaeon]|nr:cation:proton antiporter [Candidatus Nanohaloarchaea archaeon]
MALDFEFVLVLAIVYATTYAFKFLEQYDIPVLAVEILAGLVFGSMLGLVGPGIHGYEVLMAMASFGLMMIMFDAGLELDPEIVLENPRMISKLAVLTFFLPFLAGIGLALFLELGLFAAFLVGITISTTSMGLVYPLLEDYGMLETERGQVILSVTVMNDILSMVALAYGITFMVSSSPVTGAVVVTAVLLFVFVAAPLFLVDRLSELLEEKVFDNPVKVGVLSMLAVSFLMEVIGIHAILGAFFAGLLIAEITHAGHRVERSMKPILDLTAPVFFFYVGMNISFGGVVSGAPLLLVAVIALGLLSKMVGAAIGGWITGMGRKTTALLASAMPGRLSISVAAAEIGLAQGVLSQELYNTFIVLSVLSVFVASLLFRHFVDEN